MLKFIFGFVLLLIVLFILIALSFYLRVHLEDFLEKRYNNQHTIINKKIEGKVIDKNKNKTLISHGDNTVMTNVNYFVSVKTRFGTYTLSTKNDYLELTIGETYIFDRIIHKDNITGKIVQDYLLLI